MKKIFVSDYTLNTPIDCEKRLTFREKVNVAANLDRLGADAIELAEVRNGKEDKIVCQTIASTVKNCIVSIPVGFTEEGVDSAWECIKNAAKPCLQVAVPTSTVQMEYQCHKKAPQMFGFVEAICKSAKEKCENIEFVACDASRADREFLKEICKTAENNGALCVTLCDDAGIMMPDEFAKMVSDVKSVCDCYIHVKTSDMLKMAAASAVAAIKAGADGVKTSMTDANALGMETISDIIRTKGGDIGAECSIDETAVHHGMKKLTSAIDGKSNRADDGTAPKENDSVALNGESSISDVCEAVKSLGYQLSDEDNGKVFEEFRRVAEKKNSVGSRELEAIVASSAMQVPSSYHLDSYVSNSGNVITAMANVTLVRDGKKISGVSTGDGPIDASFKAIEQIVGHHYELDDFQIQAVTEGRDSIGSALVKLRANGNLYSGNGISTDIVGASIRAYINAVNKIVYEEN